MTSLIPRPADLREIEALYRVFPAVAILGPRQTGKSTLARLIAESYDEVLFLDLEDPQDLAALDAPKAVLGGRTGLVVIDEVQRRPELFPVPPNAHRCIAGGAVADSRERNTGTSPAGFRVSCRSNRISRAHGVSTQRRRVRALARALGAGGFPRAYLASDDDGAHLWLSGFLRTFLERDIPQLGISIPAPAVRRLWTMLAHRSGGTANLAAISRDLGVSQPTVTRWVDTLVDTLMVLSLPPWFENVGKRLVRSPKLYVRDSGLLHALLGLRNEEEIISHPILGASWEGFALDQTVRAIRPVSREIFFWRTHAGAEVDLLWHVGGRRYAVEFKFSDAPGITRSMKSVQEDLKPDHLWVVYPGDRRYSLSENVSALPPRRS
jgi:predicted AAA+ superfamily ATPase